MIRSTRARTCIAIAVAGASLLGGAPARAAAPTLSVTPARIVASPQLTWKGSLEIENLSDQGLRLDSLALIARDLDPGETRAPRETPLPLERMIPGDPAIAPHGRMTIPFEVPAPAESASLRFEAGFSQTSHARLTLRALADAVPGPTSRLLPSRFLSVNGRRVEVVIVPADSPATGGVPGVLLVHGHAHHARQMLRGAMLLARHGYTTALVSMPGYGLSEGPADFMGPHTVDALSAALDLLEHTPGVDATRIGAWGVSRGATAVTLLAERRRDLAAVIAQAGLYDVQALRDTAAAPGLLGSLLAEVGSDSSAWRARSPLQGLDRLHGRLLVMHGEDDHSAPALQAHAFCDSLQRHGVRADVHFFAGAGHALPRDETARIALAFFAGALRR